MDFYIWLESVIKIASMWNKIYLIALAVLSLVTLALMFYSNSWLKSITNPADVAANYENSARLGWFFLWIASAILLILANVILWQTRKAWAFWVTLGYFALFIVLQTFWLDNAFFQYKKANFPAQTGFSFSPFLGVGLCIAGAIIVFFNQFLVLRMRDKMFPPEQPAEPLSENLEGDTEVKDENPQ